MWVFYVFVVFVVFCKCVFLSVFDEHHAETNSNQLCVDMAI